MTNTSRKFGGRSIVRRPRAADLGWLIFLAATTLPFLIGILVH